MSRNPCPVTEPDAGQWVNISKINIILCPEPGQAGVNGGRAHIESRWLVFIGVLLDLIQHRVQLDHHTLEIEAGQILVVENPAFTIGRTEKRTDSRTLVKLPNILIGRLGGGLCCLHNGPFSQHSPQQQGFC